MSILTSPIYIRRRRRLRRFQLPVPTSARPDMQSEKADRPSANSIGRVKRGRVARWSIVAGSSRCCARDRPCSWYTTALSRSRLRRSSAASCRWPMLLRLPSAAWRHLPAAPWRPHRPQNKTSPADREFAREPRPPIRFAVVISTLSETPETTKAVVTTTIRCRSDCNSTALRPFDDIHYDSRHCDLNK